MLPKVPEEREFYLRMCISVNISGPLSSNESFVRLFQPLQFISRLFCLSLRNANDVFLTACRCSRAKSASTAGAAALWWIDVKTWFPSLPSPNNGADSTASPIPIRTQQRNLEVSFQTQESNIFNDLEALKERTWFYFSSLFSLILLSFPVTKNQ